MRRGLILTIVFVAILAFSGAMEVAAKDPIFVRWMVEGDPGDEAILDYWERSVRDELSARELVDLGTMLFRRGYPKDAMEYYEKATKKDPEMAEAWFRIGLVQHKQGELRQARSAYSEALERSSGHGWCNFYMGLVQEHTGNPTKSVEYYEEAFRRAPELADPEFNPEVLYSKLYLAALVRNREEKRFEVGLPMSYLEPGAVRRTRRPYEKALEEAAAPENPAESTSEEMSASGQANGKAEQSSSGASASSTGASGSGGSGKPRARSTTHRPQAADSGSKSGSTSGTQQRGGSAAGAPSVSSVSPEASLPGLWDPVRMARLR